MLKKLKLGLFFCIGFLLMFSFPLVASAADVKSQVPEPTIMNEEEGKLSLTGKAGNGNDETPGTWYSGETPSNLIPNSPVLLFVPGLNNVAQIFWENNDMYQTAYNAGYQTAFVQLHDAGGASADMWDNGELLAEKIQEISAHYGKPITVIAYSKGGVDTQTALTYYGASNYVENVITLSSPHHGSQLANLAYSNWAGWLADLIGAKGDGTYAMQTGNMENFRSQTDSNPLAYSNDYYTLGGTSWGSMFSANWFGGVYLSQYGSNDGVVTTASSRLPNGNELAIGNWTHTTIRTGATFNTFRNSISGNNMNRSLINKQQRSIDKNSPAINQWVHGGELLAKEKNATTVHVEEGVKQLNLNVLTQDQLAGIKLTDPSGKEISPKLTNSKEMEGYFVGAVRNALVIDAPEEGEWTLHMETPNDDAYLLMVDFTSKAKILKTEKHLNHNQLNYGITMDNSQVLAHTLRATYHITDTKNKANTRTFTVQGNMNMSQAIWLHKADTVYNITIDIEGKTKNGNTIKRTIIDSIHY